jgi:hypothetical protein
LTLNCGENSNTPCQRRFSLPTWCDTNDKYLKNTFQNIYSRTKMKIQEIENKNTGPGKRKIPFIKLKKVSHQSWGG